MATPSPTQKRLALAIIDHLNKCTTDGTLDASHKDSIEIAAQCIADSFSVDPTDASAMQDALGGQSLLGVYGVYEKMRGRAGGSSAATPSAAQPSSSTATPSKPAHSAPDTGSTSAGDHPSSAQDPTSKSEAESLKSQGNTAMSSKDYPAAIDLYTRALILSPSNPVYLSNRAAAYSASGQHEKAVTDAELATTTDPSYSKAWSRLGFAKYALGDSKGSVEAYDAGVKSEKGAGSEQMRKGLETAKRRLAEEGDDAGSTDRGTSPSGAAGGMPDLAGLASMLGGGGGRGAGGAGAGGFDLGSIMQNPMFAQMAQNVMSNPGMLEGLMNNPQMRQMADRLGAGRGGGAAGGEGGQAGGAGGMPDISAMMQDPSIAEMARNLMGGAGGQGGRGRGSGGNGGNQGPYA